MRIDPINDRFYSLPASADINQYEYHDLCMSFLPDRFVYATPEQMKHVSFMLVKMIGTPTALRLVTDLAKLHADHQRFIAK
jgi:hypothetical protein